MKRNKVPILFTVDLEDWYHAVYPPEKWANLTPSIEEPIDWLLEKLKKYDIKGVFYVLGHVAERHPEMVKRIHSEGHKIGSHGYKHSHNEQEGDESDLKCRKILTSLLGIPEKMPYRSPYWDSTPMPGLCGGFFFRALPYSFFVKMLNKSRVFWIHPHDFNNKAPKIDNFVIQAKRRIGLSKNIKRYLERLLQYKNFIRVP